MVLKQVSEALRSVVELLSGSGRGVVLVGLSGIADAVNNSLAGTMALGAIIGAALMGSGFIIRYLPGTSADWRQTAAKMIEGGAILTAVMGAGSLILGGAAWIGNQLASSFGAQGNEVPSQYLNPWRP